MLSQRTFAMIIHNAVSSFSVQKIMDCHFVHINLPVILHSFCHDLDFRWGWNYKVMKGAIPSTATWVNDSAVFIGSPFITRHVTHFAESVNQLLVKLRNPSLYPPVAAVYLPKFDSRHEYEWSSSYIKLLLSVFPHPIRLITKNQHPLLCFKWAVFLDSIFKY